LNPGQPFELRAELPIFLALLGSWFRNFTLARGWAIHTERHMKVVGDFEKHEIRQDLCA
jgi:hypothetical protein